MKVYGPYLRRDGRQVVILYEKGFRTTVSYPKYLMEERLGRKLSRDETIHHKDGNPLNNKPENLEILSMHAHGKKDSMKNERVTVNCLWCNGSFSLDPGKYNSNRANDRAGPFCSKECVGSYGAYIQNGGKPLVYEKKIEVVKTK